MEEKIVANVPPSFVWGAWERAHLFQGNQGIQQGEKGKGRGKIAYEITDVSPGKNFSILWKGFCISLLFTYSVEPFLKGSKIGYLIEMKGLFGAPVRWFLGKKIDRSIKGALLSFIKRLEDEYHREAGNRGRF